MPDIEGVPYETTGTPLDQASAQALAARNREAISAGVAAGTEAKALAQSVVADVSSIRTSVEQSAAHASAASEAASQAQQTATDLVPRMEQIEVMAGLAPGEVTDAQTANLISQDSTATRDALNAAIDESVPPLVAEAISADPTPALAAAAAVGDAVAGMELVGVEDIEADSAEFYDADSGLLFAVDNLSGTPTLRGGGAQPPADGGYTETHLIVAAGQSNMVGVGGPIPDLTNTPLSNLYTVPQKGASAGQIIRAVEPLDHPWDAVGTTSRGHAFRFAQLYAAANPGVRVVIVPVARAGTGFRSDTLVSWAPAREAESGMDSLYRNAIDSTNATAALFTGTVKVGAILWHQGEDDATAATPKTQYISDLDDMIAGFRSEMTGATTAPFILGQMLHEFITIRAEGTVLDIDAAHQETPARVTRTAYYPNPGPGYGKTDNTHYNGHGQWLLGASAWDAYQSALYNI